MIDTTTTEGRERRLSEIVEGYVERRNFPAVARLIGGSPRYDLQDYTPADEGEPPQGANWN